MNGREIIKKLEQAGWMLSRIEGSHHIMEKSDMLRPVPVPVHGNHDIGIGLLKKIEKQSGVRLK
jgi:predicted RNA binding protein YcfA (HicA-like mRNA interferase family)